MMTKDEIIRMAGDSWLTSFGAERLRDGFEVMVDIEELETFVALVTAAEREACLAEIETGIWFDKNTEEILDSITSAIRTRGEQ